MPPSEHLLTEQQVAEMLSVTVHGVRKWRIKGYIAFIKIGKTIRFEPEEVEAFVKRNRKAPACHCHEQTA